MVILLFLPSFLEIVSGFVVRGLLPTARYGVIALYSPKTEKLHPSVAKVYDCNNAICVLHLHHNATQGVFETWRKENEYICLAFLFLVGYKEPEASWAYGWWEIRDAECVYALVKLNKGSKIVNCMSTYESSIHGYCSPREVYCAPVILIAYVRLHLRHRAFERTRANLLCNECGAAMMCYRQCVLHNKATFSPK